LSVVTQVDKFCFGNEPSTMKDFEEGANGATYCFENEDHTLGNSLRYMLNKR